MGLIFHSFGMVVSFVVLLFQVGSYSKFESTMRIIFWEVFLVKFLVDTFLSKEKNER